MKITIIDYSSVTEIRISPLESWQPSVSKRDIDALLDELNGVGYSEPLNVCYGDVDHPVPGQIDHWVS